MTLTYSLKYCIFFFEENHKKWKITKNTGRNKAQNYAKKTFGSEITVHAPLRKKDRSQSRAFKTRSKNVQNRLQLRNILRKMKDFQALK
jgi:uncharacterized protein YkwD